MKRRTPSWLRETSLSIAAFVCVSVAPVALQAAPVNFVFPAEKYEQTVEIVFNDEDAAKKATVRIAPLYNGYEWAVSSRWDDNTDVNLMMRDLLEKHEQKGTFYLNSWRIAWLSSATPQMRLGTGAEGFRRWAKQLLKGGNSIGGHSLSHPMLTFCNRNRMFEETARVRAEWEAITDSRVLSFVFPFTNSSFWGKTGFIKDPVAADLARLLERAGYYHVATQHFHGSTDLIRSPFMPHDGQEIDTFVQRSLHDKNYKTNHPIFTHAMHAWAFTGSQKREILKDQLNKYGHNPDWWYCNQNEYAAYRYQYRHSKLTQLERVDHIVRLRLDRPELLALNDSTPLTLEVTGVSDKEVREVKCGTAECVKSDRQTGGDRYRFQLHHDRNQALPQKIGLVANNGNRTVLRTTDQDADFPGLRALLYFKGERLHVELDNQTKLTLTKPHITYRIPLAWNEGIVQRSLADVSAGSRHVDTLVPTRRTNDYKYNAGVGFFVAQVDFRLGSKPGRLHLSCNVASPRRDPSYPQGGFLRLGPLSNDQLDIEKLAAGLADPTKATDALLGMSNTTRIRWEGNDTPSLAPYLSPEIIRTTGEWGPVPHQFWLLWASVESDGAQEVRLMIDGLKSVDRVFINGRDRTTQKSVNLIRGENSFVIVYHAAGNHNPLNAGCFLRVIQSNFERVKNIRFQQPIINQ